MLELLDRAGESTNINNPWVQFLQEEARAVRRMYHIAHAQTGDFNDDTEPFLDWLGWFMSEGQEDPSLQPHIYTQIRIAIYEPTSELGRRIRLIEAGADPLFEGDGPSAYWEYLIGPANNRLWTNAMSHSVAQSEFERLASEYNRTMISNPSAYADFGAYLASIHYDMFGRLPTN